MQEAFVYVSQYLFTIDPSLPRLWTEEDDPKKHSHVPSGKGALLVMEREFQAIVNNHCILNTPIMAKWVDMFIQARTAREREREAWKRAHGGRRAPAFPRELAKFSDLIDIEWIHDVMTKAKAQGEEISPKEWEYARGCLPKVSKGGFGVSVCVCGCDLVYEIFVYKHNMNWFCRVLHSTLCGPREGIFAHARLTKVEPRMIVASWAILTHPLKRSGIVAL